jgi:hypothetical protein
MDISRRGPMPLIPRNHKLISTRQELLEIAALVGLHGISEKTLLDRVNASLTTKGKDTVEMSTLRRAKNSLQDHSLPSVGLETKSASEDVQIHS